MSAKPLLVLGTGSHVGKSLLVAGLCRILSDQGVDVAPFKAQNMALNSAVTPDGGEIGRAQALQAQAARLLPSRDMNPVLLKPVSNQGSQVILLGQAQATLSARQYYRFWPQAARVARQAYERLAQAHQAVILEGAGSPAEVNLMSRDLANLEAARFSQAPWVLVADIEKGGSFASIVGTLALVPAWLRRRFRGVVFNKFRGDSRLLDPGIAWLKARRIPCLGVLPYLEDLVLDEEDSQSLAYKKTLTANKKALKIEVILNRRISNFNDIKALQGLQDVALVLRKPGSKSPFKEPDLIILPGSKASLADLWDLQMSGEAERLREMASKGCYILGICGGYQMLGTVLDDSLGIEGKPCRGEGLGLLLLNTRFGPVKELREGFAEAAIFKRKFKVKGYEIHQGSSKVFSPDRVWLRRSKDKAVLGSMDPAGRVLGTYLHGILDNPAFTLSLLDRIARARGSKLRFERRNIPSLDQEAQLDRWADHLRQHLDLKRLLA
jgi:adenosylcobyric acid synthase